MLNKRYKEYFSLETNMFNTLVGKSNGDPKT